jgi:exonuclease III
MQNHIIVFMPLNERLCRLSVRDKYNNITLINCYASTEDKDEVKQQFCEDIQMQVENIPKSDTVIILGDLNAQLGKEEVSCEYIE